MDRMRESMFHILGPLEGFSFLDLFSGSGIVGIEAASRGCSPVYCIEKDKGKKRTLLKNISIAESEIKASFMPAERYIMTAKRRFDIVFLDPPFRYPYKEELLERVGTGGLLGEEGICILHLPKNERTIKDVSSLSVYDERTFGRSLLLFFRGSREDGEP